MKLSKSKKLPDHHARYRDQAYVMAECAKLAKQSARHANMTATNLSQRGLIRAVNRIIHEVDTIREEGMRKDRNLDAPALWYALDRLAAIRDVAIAAIANDEGAGVDGIELEPEDLDDENFDLTISMRK